MGPRRGVHEGHGVLDVGRDIGVPSGLSLDATPGPRTRREPSRLGLVTSLALQTVVTVTTGRAPAPPTVVTLETSPLPLRPAPVFSLSSLTGLSQKRFFVPLT